MDTHYDLLVIGSGPAGHVGALTASRRGMKTVVIEAQPEKFGGVCLNEGCIPAKSLFHSARVIRLLKQDHQLFKLDQNAAFSIHMPEIVSRSKKASEELRSGLQYLFKKNKVDIVYGKASFLSGDTIAVRASDGKVTEIKASRMLIASGSATKEIPGIVPDGKKIITSTQAISLDRVPENVFVIGAGAIGVEFASYFNILGSQVVLSDMEEYILPREDREVSKKMRSALERGGIEVRTLAHAKRDELEGYEIILLAPGRSPSTAGLGLEKAGVAVDAKGFIKVDQDMRTSAENIYAAGDVAGEPMLAHAAYAEGEIAALSASGLSAENLDKGHIPNVVYSDPKSASVGLTEEEARKRGIDYKVGKCFFKANGRAIVERESEGFIKVLAETSTGKLVGAHILGGPADEIIHEFVLAINGSLTVDRIAKAVHAHPTFSEAVAEAARSVFSAPLHG